jgi:hypothetical protein
MSDAQNNEQPARNRGRLRKLKRLVGRGPLRQPLREPVHEPRESARDEASFISPLKISIRCTSIRNTAQHRVRFRFPSAMVFRSVLGQPQDEVMSAHRKNKFQEGRKGSSAACSLSVRPRGPYCQRRLGADGTPLRLTTWREPTNERRRADSSTCEKSSLSRN